MANAKSQSVNFDWMSQNDPGEAFSPFLDQSLVPFDLGDSGYSACTNVGGEILEVTAPSDLCGYVSVKGGYDDSMDSLLARAQRPFGQNATFSLKVVNKSQSHAPDRQGPSCRLGPLKERGSLNHRWPFTRYWLDADGGEVVSHEGTCAFFSFVRQQTVFQVVQLRLFQAPTDGLGEVSCMEHSGNGGENARKSIVYLELGGPMRFSCRCGGLAHKGHTVSWDEGEVAWKMETEALPDARFYLKVYEEGEAVNLSRSAILGDILADGEDLIDPPRLSPWETRCRQLRARFKTHRLIHTVHMTSGKATTVMAAFKLESCQFPGVTGIPILTDEAAAAVAGLRFESPYASNWMWRSLLSPEPLMVDQSAKPSLFYSPHLALIQRCLERILSAHCVKFKVDNLECGVDIWPHVPGSAVSIKQLFWILRFLAHVLRQLRRPSNTKYSSVEYYLGEIRAHILRTVKFVIVASKNVEANNQKWWSPNYKVPNVSNVPPTHSFRKYEDAEDEYNCFYYAPTIWCGLRSLQATGLLQEYNDIAKLIAENFSSVVDGLKAIGDNHVSTRNSATFSIHKWHHYQSLVEIMQLASQPKYSVRAWLYDPKMSQSLAEAKEKAETWRLSFNKALANRLASKRAYTRKDEEADRLMFYLAKEFGMAREKFLPGYQLVRKRILSRSRTMTINPGINAGTQTMSNAGRCLPPSSTPWELHSLCHHASLLNYSNMEWEAGFRFGNACLQFLCSDESIIPTWERSTVTSLAGWFSIEPTCVIATTMLQMLADIQKKHHAYARQHDGGQGHEKEGEQDDEQDHDRDHDARTEPTMSEASDISISALDLQATSAVAFEGPDGMRPTSSSGKLAWPFFTRVGLVRALRGMVPPLAGAALHYHHDIKDNHRIELDHSEEPPGQGLGVPAASSDVSTLAEAIRLLGGLPSPIDWALYKFPTTHHPEWFLHSLDDSPNLFSETELSQIELRPRLRHHLEREPGSRPPKYLLDALGATLHAKDCSKLTIIDLMSPGFFMEQDTDTPRSVITGRAAPNNFFPLKFSGVDLGVQINLFAAFLDKVFCGRQARELTAQETKCLSSPQQRTLDRMRDEREVDMAREQLQAKLLEKLGDSLVDQQVQCRYFFIQDWPKNIVEPFVYLWHTELLDSFEDHLGNASTFSHSSTETAWTLSLTVLHWSIYTTCDKKSGHVKRFPPDTSQPSHHQAPHDPSEQTYWILEQPEPTTIVMTTNMFGDFVKCSVVSKILAESTIYKFAHTATEIWTKFSNQPQSGRCLVFLHLVGLVCEAMALKYEMILGVLNDHSKYSKSTLDFDFQWTAQPQAVERLQYYLWQLGVIQLFHHNTSESVGQIKALEHILTSQIQDGPGRRHKVLEDLSRQQIELFSRRFSRLRTVCKNLEQKIDSLTKIRDGISSLCGLQDSRTGIRQDDHIRILTWVTIGYLPLSFVTAIFAVPTSQNVVADGLGLGWYIGILAIFFLGTVVLANLLRRILKGYEGWSKAKEQGEVRER